MNAKRGTLWSEDDCTYNLPGHETARAAYKRLMGFEFDAEDAVSVDDLGDGVEYVMPGCVVWMSFPGNSAIYERLCDT